MKKYLFLGAVVFGLVSFFSHPSALAQSSDSSDKEGKLVVVVEDDFERNSARKKYFLQKSDHSILTLDETDKIKTIPAGSKIRVRDNAVELLESATIESNAITGQNNVAVILANFNNLSVSDPSNATVKTTFDQKLAPFMKEMSFGKATFVADVYGWVSMSVPSTCEPSIIAPNAIAAADSLIDYNKYKYVMIAFPNTNCPYGGWGYYPPGVTYQTAEGAKTLIVNALPNDYMRDWMQTVGAHELGHNMGLKHANGWECGGTSIGATCTSTEYGDQFDVMGGTYSYIGHYGAYNKEFLQWITPSNTKVITQSGKYTIQPIEKLTTGIQSLKIARGTSDTYYNIENRMAIGTDSTLPNNARNGALIKIVSISTTGLVEPVGSNIIDSTPGSQTSDFHDAGWVLRKTFDDTQYRVRITPVSKKKGILTVDVLFY